MSELPKVITLDEWDHRYEQLRRSGLREPSYSGPIGRHVQDGDVRLEKLRYDNSPAALRLWNFLLTEEDRLAEARAEGARIVGTMKDLGTVPVLVYSLEHLVAFYPDAAWWIPCIMQHNAGLLKVADSFGIDESFCPVRAMIGAFVTEAHFPIPDLLICSVGATCDDFSSIAQRLNSLGHPILWWEIPHRRHPDRGEEGIELPGGFVAPKAQIDFVRSEFDRITPALEELAGEHLDDDKLARGIRKANTVRALLAELRESVFTARTCPLPALEMLIAEMLAIHFCSDQGETISVLTELRDEVRQRVQFGTGVLGPGAARIFWVNPVADLWAMNLLEACGGRVCGTDYLFSHALDPIPEDLPGRQALARMALADPMVGSATDRAERICSDIRRFGSEGVLVSRIPGASHCAVEGAVIGDIIGSRLGLPVVEIEIPSVTDSMLPTLRTRLEALVETIVEQRKHKGREQ